MKARHTVHKAARLTTFITKNAILESVMNLHFAVSDKMINFAAK